MTSETGRDGGSAPTGVFVAETAAERDDAFAVRRATFVDEQGVDEAVEYDEHDESDAAATHFVAYDAGEPVGAARLRVVDDADDPAAKVERVAVAADRRDEGWGRRVMDAVESRAHADGIDRLALHAQTRVRGFYERLGYEAHGEPFEEAGIPHVAMDKELGDGER